MAVAAGGIEGAKEIAAALQQNHEITSLTVCGKVNKKEADTIMTPPMPDLAELRIWQGHVIEAVVT